MLSTAQGCYEDEAMCGSALEGISCLKAGFSKRQTLENIELELLIRKVTKAVLQEGGY